MLGAMGIPPLTPPSGPPSHYPYPDFRTTVSCQLSSRHVSLESEPILR